VIAVPLMIPLGNQAAPCCIYAFQPSGNLQVVTVIFPLLVGLTWRKHETKTYQKQGH